jgi:hypothetical protein
MKERIVLIGLGEGSVSDDVEPLAEPGTDEVAIHVGLLAEGYDPRIRRQHGNLPKHFSHVALVNTALNLVRRRGPSQQRGESLTTLDT